MEYKCVLVALFLLNVVCLVRQTSSEKTQNSSVDQDERRNETRPRVKRSRGGKDVAHPHEWLGVAVALESTLESPAHETYWFGGVFVRIAKDAIIMHRETFQRSFKFLTGRAYIGHLVFDAKTFDLGTYPKDALQIKFRLDYEKHDFVAGEILRHPNNSYPLPELEHFDWEDKKDKNLASNCYLYAYHGNNLIAKKRTLRRYNPYLLTKFSPDLDTVQLSGGGFDLCIKDHDLGSPVMCYSSPNERGQMTFYAIAKRINFSENCVKGFEGLKTGAIFEDLRKAIPIS